MSVRHAEILLLTALIVRSSSFLFSKVALETMEPVTLLAIRSLIAFAVLAVLFRKRLSHINRRTLFHGALLGGAFFIVMVFELYGLASTPASVTVFIENTAIVFVPLFFVILTRKLPNISTFISSTAALTGVAFLTLKNDGFSFTPGELLCFGAAMTYAAAIIITAHIAKENDALSLGILQNGFIGLFSVPAAYLMETPALPSDSAAWICILILALLCSVVGFTLQPIAQKYMNANRAGLFCAVSPLSATILGIIFLGETLDTNGIIGIVLIMSSLILANVPAKLKSSTSPCEVKAK